MHWLDLTFEQFTTCEGLQAVYKLWNVWNKKVWSSPCRRAWQVCRYDYRVNGNAVKNLFCKVGVMQQKALNKTSQQWSGKSQAWFSKTKELRFWLIPITDVWTTLHTHLMLADDFKIKIHTLISNCQREFMFWPKVFIKITFEGLTNLCTLVW